MIDTGLDLKIRHFVCEKHFFLNSIKRKSLGGNLYKPQRMKDKGCATLVAPLKRFCYFCFNFHLSLKLAISLR